MAISETKFKGKSRLGKPHAFVLLICSVCLFVLGSLSVVGYRLHLRAVDDAILSNRAMATSIARVFVEHERAATGIMQAYASRKLLRDVVARKDSPEMLRQLVQLTGDNPEIGMAVVTDRAGTLWANLPVHEESHGQNFSYRDWYKGVSAEWKPYVSGVYKQVIGEKDLAVLVCVPVTDEKGGVIGILGTSQGTVFLGNILHQLRLIPDARLTLIDQTGNVIVGDTFSNLREVTAFPFYPSIREALGKGETDLRIRDPSSGDRLRYVSIAQVEGIGWTVIVEKESGRIIRSELGHLLLLGIIAFISCLFACVMVVLVRKEFVQRYRQMEENLRVQKEIGERDRRYASLVENVGMIVIGLDLHGNIISANPFLLKLTGYAWEELTGRNWFDMFIPEKVRESAKELFHTILQKEPPSPYELPILTRSGEQRTVAWNDILLRESDSGTARLMSIGEDITARKQGEEKLRETEAKYIQAQKMEAVGRLAGGVAHDFNNILTAIYGYCDILLVKVPEGQAEHSFVAEIRKAAVRAASLTQQLLAFSRRQTLQPKIVNLNDLVRNLQKMLGRMIGEDIDLKLALADSIWAMRADPTRIEQVLMNLAVNASDAMPKGGKLLIETQNVQLGADYVQSHPGAAEGEYVMVAVSDSGIGMDSETQSHLFEPFFTTKELGKGTGLGLATVYGIVKQSGGIIWVYSEVGKGTTFKVYLPRVAEEVTPLPAAERAPHERARGHETILYVEDDDAVRNLVTLILRENGYTVLAAANGEEAVHDSSLVIGTVDMMITDVVMPKMNGRELADRMKKISPSLKILFTSGYTSNTIAHHNVLDQGIDFIEKPVTADALLKKIREILDG